MKLTTDDHFRLHSRTLFKKKTAYDVEKQSDGSIVIREMTSQEPEKPQTAKLRRYKGFWVGPSMKIDKEELVRIINEDREGVR